MFVPDNINFQTKEIVADYMASLLPKDAKHILEPTPGAGRLIAAAQRAFTKRKQEAPTVWGPTLDYWDMQHIVEKYDAVIMNPPFTPTAVLESFLDDVCLRSEIIISIVPWFALINSDSRRYGFIDFGLVSVTFLPRNAFPGSRTQCCVIHLKKGHKRTPKLLDFKKSIKPPKA